MYSSGVARFEWARVQRFKKGPVIPLTGFVCSANKHSSYSCNVWVGLIGLKFVIHAISVISDETNYCRLVIYTIQEKFILLINRMVEI